MSTPDSNQVVMLLAIDDEMFFNAAVLADKEILDSRDAPTACVLSDNQRIWCAE